MLFASNFANSISIRSFVELATNSIRRLFSSRRLTFLFRPPRRLLRVSPRFGSTNCNQKTNERTNKTLLGGFGGGAALLAPLWLAAKWAHLHAASDGAAAYLRASPRRTIAADKTRGRARAAPVKMRAELELNFNLSRARARAIEFVPLCLWPL